jgi:hypothetical protein
MILRRQRYDFFVKFFQQIINFVFEENRIANDPGFLDFTIPEANRIDLGAVLGINKLEKDETYQTNLQRQK